MKKILFVCSGGMSSAIVEKALDKAADKKGIEIESKAVGTGTVEDTINNEDWDLVLVAPQVKHRFEIVKEYAEKKNIPAELIPPRDYSPLGGENLIKLVENLD